MNCANTEKLKFMMQHTKNRYLFRALFLLFSLFGGSFLMAQDKTAGVDSLSTETLNLDSIFARMDRNNLQLQSFLLRAEGYKHQSEAATAWMAPMAGLGTFMTPYPGQPIMEARDRGSVMLQVEQSIPNNNKLKAKKEAIAAKSSLEMAKRGIGYNELKAQARLQYYSWIMAERKIKVVDEALRLMETMKKIEEVRYPYNQSLLSGIFKAEARIQENRNMRLMYEGEIQKARYWLNGLMNQAGPIVFQIDTTALPSFQPQLQFDTTQLALARKDIAFMEASIELMNQEVTAMKLERKPDFKVRFDHMFPLDGMMPKAFSAMGMISIPIAPWSAKMYKNEVKAMEFNIQAMQKERAAMLQETQGMLYGMQSEILAMKKRLENMETKIIPSLQKSMDANFQLYQENKQTLAVVVSDWEALVMMKLNWLEEYNRYLKMMVDYEKERYQ